VNALRGSAVRAACAYLAAGGREDAYLALRTARDLLSLGSVAGGAVIDNVLTGLRAPAERVAANLGARRPVDARET
jgi:hypothetical protein